MFNTITLKIINILMNIINNQIDTDVSFWVGQFKLLFKLEHRYGGDIRLGVDMFDETANDNRICWSNVDYIGIWDDTSWTPCPSKLAALVEKAVVRAEEAL